MAYELIVALYFCIILLIIGRKKVNNKPFIRYHYLRLILAIFFNIEFFDSFVSMHKTFDQYFKSDALKKQIVINE